MVKSGSISANLTPPSPMSLHITVTRFRPEVGLIGPKWDKSGKFSDQIQYILAHLTHFGAKSGNRGFRPNVNQICPKWDRDKPGNFSDQIKKVDLKKSPICPILSLSGPKSDKTILLLSSLPPHYVYSSLFSRRDDAFIPFLELISQIYVAYLRPDKATDPHKK